MKKIICTMVLVSLVFWGTSYAGSFVPDTYLHPFDRDAGQVGVDILGSSPPFDISGSQWADNGLSLTIFLNWDLPIDFGPSGVGVRLGDVFMYTPNGVYAVALRNHGFVLNGQNAEDSSILAGNIFAVTSVRTSDYYYDPVFGLDPLPTTNYGDREIATAFGNVVGQATLTYTPGSSILISFATPDFNNSNIRFTQTCGNDVYATPEPGTLLMLGLGLFGLGLVGGEKEKIVADLNSPE